jgi:hypothetical protein
LATGNLWSGTDVNAMRNVNLNNDINMANGKTIRNEGRLHIHPQEALFLLPKGGTYLTKDWGASGDLSVQGDINATKINRSDGDWLRISGTPANGTAMFNGVSINDGGGLSVGQWKKVPQGELHVSKGVNVTNYDPGALIEKQYGNNKADRYGLAQEPGGETHVYAAQAVGPSTVNLGFATGDRQYNKVLTVHKDKRTELHGSLLTNGDIHVTKGVNVTNFDPGALIEKQYGNNKADRYGLAQERGGETHVYAAQSFGPSTVNLGFATGDRQYNKVLTVHKDKRTQLHGNLCIGNTCITEAQLKALLNQPAADKAAADRAAAAAKAAADRAAAAAKAAADRAAADRAAAAAKAAADKAAADRAAAAAKAAADKAAADRAAAAAKATADKAAADRAAAAANAAATKAAADKAVANKTATQYAIFYEYPNKGGKSITIIKGQKIPDIHIEPYKLGDAISEIFMTGNIKVTVYQHRNYNGSKTTYSTIGKGNTVIDVNTLTSQGFNDGISSIIVE